MADMAAATVTVKMEADGDTGDPPQDFVKDFQEYLTQQTNQVNLISGSIGSETDPEPLNGVGDPSALADKMEGCLEDGLGLPLDGYERTQDGKLKCKYCDYACKGTARLEEHMRTHTGEKPYRCHLCSFASAYVRHLEAHMRSHTGEKPYKCNLCSFRCSDRSNLSHHRRRRHKTSGLVGLSGLAQRGILANRRSLLGLGAAFVRRAHHAYPGHSGSLSSASSYNLHQHGGGGYGGRRASLSLNMSPPTMVGMGHGSIAPQSNARFHGDDLAPSMRNYSSLSDGGVAPEMSEETPLSQLSALAGQISCLVSGEVRGTQTAHADQRGRAGNICETGRINEQEELDCSETQGIICSETGQLIEDGNKDGLALQERDGKIMEHLYAAHNLEMPANGPVVAASISLAQEHSPAHSSPEPQSHHSAQHHHHHQQQHHHSQPSSRQTSPYPNKQESGHHPPSGCSPIRLTSSSEMSLRANTPSSTGSHRSTPALPVLQTPGSCPQGGRLSPMRGPPALTNQADTEAHQCPHCDIYFPDNILYTIHMGCHGYENPFQCNVCGYCCHDRYDFSCHFARGQHKR
ncbi:zinc finger protein Pegasus-like [Lethenteron reissneri]|uniref:zinc finger protein Pegasus-like n=1 Tax=Lethenteron reissneri TaxID=7753 RepID=UPI002AB7EE21|nr:zinc finger protein Pegasus-like [Lethenteron reissneri]XP_061433980.1 zinc finger protein Pegasus-like [Lethenteron reissneri]